MKDFKIGLFFLCCTAWLQLIPETAGCRVMGGHPSFKATKINNGVL